MATKSDFAVSTAPSEIILTRTINAPRELVFDAFTKKEHLEKWFGPRVFTTTAETDPHVGGKYRITMHGSDNLPADFRGPFPMKGEYLEFIRPEKLIYTTNLIEHPDSWKSLMQSGIENGETANFLSSLVTITFDDLGGKTKLAIRTRFDSDAVRDGYVKFQMAEGWSESLDKLEEMLTGVVVVERTFDAPIEQVWDAITNNDAIKQWYFKLPEFRAEVGFEFGFEGGPPGRPPYTHKCKVTEIIPGKKLAYTWRYEGWKGISTVAWELFAEGNQTKLRLTHSGLDSFGINNNPDLDAQNFVAGWTGILGTSLKEFVETRASANERSMAVTRILNAPRELVWKVFSDPDHIKNWWGPNGFSLTTHEYEMRTGGQWNFTMHGPDGTDYPNTMIFEEIIPKERIVFMHGQGPKFQMIIQLFDRGDKTELHWRNVFKTAEDYKQAVEVFHAIEGQKQTIDRLGAYLKSI